MHLYEKPECPFCWKVKLALDELELEWTETVFATPERPPDFLALHPGGTVPVLVDGANVVTDSAIILEYLEDKAGTPCLLPESPGARARARALHLYATSTIGPVLREVVFEKRGRPEAQWDLERIEAGARGWARCLDELETLIGDHPYFAERFSFAECALIPRFGLAELYGVGVTPAHPRLEAWFERMRARESYRRTAPAGLLTH